MTTNPRILSLATAQPPFEYAQEAISEGALERVLGADWRAQPDLAERRRQLVRLFEATRVERRQFAVDLLEFYSQPRTTGERMATYKTAAYTLGRAALESALRQADGDSGASAVTDFVVVSCTGYTAPGLDILLARDLGLPNDVRRVSVGHMGCYGALVGLRQCLAAVRAHESATAALLSVELAGLHFSPTDDTEVLTSFALFGDAAAALTLSTAPQARGPELVDTYAAADFSGADQMTWNITDDGFMMTLSPRVPVTLRRTVRATVERLLEPHGLTVPDVAHWIIHPGGPAILDVIQNKLELSDAQMACSWQTLREHGNCSSATVLLILDALLRSGVPRPGEWGVMMAFGPGLTLETALWRF